ncbi:MAG: TraB/GumN family protein [Ignavibacteria bacterium]|nr:TraB/GumN family protein [Ignavibacteria bacterium]
MTTKLFTQCILGIITSCTFGQELTAADNSLLWKVTSKEGAVSHIFGTIHLPDTLMFRQRDTVLSVLNASSVFYAELDLDSLMTSVDPMSMMLPPGLTLANFFTTDELAELRAILKERLGPMATMAERMKPAAIAIMAMTDNLEATASTTVDQFLWAHARSRFIQVRGIESIAEQMNVLDSIPPRMVLEALRENETSDSLIKALLFAYSTENLEEISRLVDSVSAVESFMSTINDHRNNTMASRLQEPLLQGKAFIAVGAAHLPGKQGLLNVLAERGFAVEPVFGGNRVQWLRQ